MEFGVFSHFEKHVHILEQHENGKIMIKTFLGNKGAWEMSFVSVDNRPSMEIKWLLFLSSFADHTFGKQKKNNLNINLAFNMINCRAFSLNENAFSNALHFTHFSVCMFCMPHTFYQRN